MWIDNDKASLRPYRINVGSLRHHLTRHCIWAMWLIAAALFMKVVVPAGYMPVISGGSIIVELCSGAGPEKMPMAMPGMADHRGKSDHSQHDDMPCGFAGHAPESMTGVDPILLVILIAFLVATAFRMPIFWPIQRVSYLRPHLRGPPASPNREPNPACSKSMRRVQACAR